jgi:hypothetical protein
MLSATHCAHWIDTHDAHVHIAIALVVVVVARITTLCLFDAVLFVSRVAMHVDVHTHLIVCRYSLHIYMYVNLSISNPMISYYAFAHVCDHAHCIIQLHHSSFTTIRQSSSASANSSLSNVSIYIFTIDLSTQDTMAVCDV